jgi:hypothetical protein
MWAMWQLVIRPGLENFHTGASVYCDCIVQSQNAGSFTVIKS